MDKYKDTLFQFHKGAIRTNITTAVLTILAISIP